LLAFAADAGSFAALGGHRCPRRRRHDDQGPADPM